MPYMQGDADVAEGADRQHRAEEEVKRATAIPQNAVVDTFPVIFIGGEGVPRIDHAQQPSDQPQSWQQDGAMKEYLLSSRPQKLQNHHCTKETSNRAESHD